MPLAREHGLSNTILLATDSSEEIDHRVDCFDNRFSSDELLDGLLVDNWPALRIATQHQERDLNARTKLAIKDLNAKSRLLYNLSHYEAKQRNAYHK